MKAEHHEIEPTETGFEYGVMHKYNIITTSENIQYFIEPQFKLLKK